MYELKRAKIVSKTVTQGAGQHGNQTMYASNAAQATPLAGRSQRRPGHARALAIDTGVKPVAGTTGISRDDTDLGPVGQAPRKA